LQKQISKNAKVEIARSNVNIFESFEKKKSYSPRQLWIAASLESHR
jgi:hypothetical protein